MTGSTRHENSRLYLALLHWPIKDRLGEVVTGSVYMVDMHDLSRLGRTFDIGGVFIVHPVEAQRALCQRILDHWRSGYGAHLNPNRGDALSRTKVTASLDEVLATILSKDRQQPLIFTTTARKLPEAIPHHQVTELLDAGRSVLILLGTGWGLVEDMIHGFDGVLQPIEGLGQFNHLSVRSAASILLDRILWRQRQ